MRAVVPSIFVLSGIASIASKDTNDINSAPDTFTRLKTIGNVVFGRTFGLNPFASAKNYSPTINPSGLFNRYVGAGLIASLIYPHIPGVPHKGLVKKAGGAAIAGGMLGIFDPAETSNQGSMAAAQQRGLSQGGAGSGLST